MSRPTGHVEAYLERLERELTRGMCWRSPRVIREIADHLADDAEQRVAHGADRRQAEQAAVEAAGPVTATAQSLRSMLALQLARQSALVLLSLLLAVTAFWEVLMAHDPEAGQALPPLIEAIRVAGWLGLAVLGAAVASSGAASRAGVSSTTLVSLLAFTVHVVTAVCVGMALAILLDDPSWAGWAITLGTTVAPLLAVSALAHRAIAVGR